MSELEISRRHTWHGAAGASARVMMPFGPARAQPGAPKRILFVVSNPAIAASNAMPMGF